MKKEILISVVIPAYNQSAYIADAIESVLKQTYSNFELIVVDDGSTDTTRSVVERYSSNVHYIWQENKGLPGARNTGIYHARSSLICLLDADDEWLPQYLEKMSELVDEDPDAAVYYCCAQAMDKDGKKLPEVLGCRANQPEHMLESLLRANFLIPSTVMLNYASITSKDYFDESFRRLQDWELWIRLLKQGYRFKGLHEILVNYRLHDESLSVNTEAGQKAALALALKHYGVDDGKPEQWALQKRQAYGGVYRYNTLTTVQRQGDWNLGAKSLSRALESDPSLADDLDLFYNLALIKQMPGYRGTGCRVEVKKTFTSILNMLASIFDEGNNQKIADLRSKTFGTASYAMGLAAYNTGHWVLCRRFFMKALLLRPDLWLNGRLWGDLGKSFLKPLIIQNRNSLLYDI